jgi:hypothetical protein
LFFPLVGLISYLIVNGHGIAERQQKDVQKSQAGFDDYVKSVSGGRRRRADREGEGVARRRNDHPGGVRPAESEGAGDLSRG